jgi:hypothetical protein
MQTLVVDLRSMNGAAGFFEDGEWVPLHEVQFHALSDREYAEIIGGLQLARDTLRNQGMTGDGVQAALDRLMSDYLPGSNGMVFAIRNDF